MSNVRILLVLLILVASILLRLHNYAVYPQRGATSDEYTYAFLGISLFTKGVPIAWSAFTSYPEKTHLTIENLYFPVAQPYFDHPPLNGLVTGAWALLFGEDSFEKVTLSTIRLVSIILATISSLLLFLIANKLYGYKIALWALMIYSTVTIFVMNARVVVAENLLTVLFLASMYMLLQFLEKRNNKNLILLAIFCGLAMLTKVVGIAVFLATLYILVLSKTKRDLVLKFIGIFLLFPVSLLLYAAHYDWSLFWSLQKEQAGRPIGPFTFYMLIRQPTIVNAIVHDGWYYAGFFALFASFMDWKKHMYIIVYSFLYLLVLLATLSSDGLSGWYLLPLFPLMSMAVAVLFEKGIREASWVPIVLLMFIGMFQMLMFLQLPYGLNHPAYRMLLGVFFIPFLLLYLRRDKKPFQLLSELWFYLLILGNIAITYNYIHPA